MDPDKQRGTMVVGVMAVEQDIIGSQVYVVYVSDHLPVGHLRHQPHILVSQ